MKSIPLWLQPIDPDRRVLRSTAAKFRAKAMRGGRLQKRSKWHSHRQFDDPNPGTVMSAPSTVPRHLAHSCFHGQES